MTQELRRLAEAYPMEYDPMGKSGKENLQRCLNYNAFHAAANPAAVISLLDQIQTLQAENEQYKDLLELSAKRNLALLAEQEALAAKLEFAEQASKADFLELQSLGRLAKQATEAMRRYRSNMAPHDAAVVQLINQAIKRLHI